jgi:hypothetical protein
MRAHRHQRCGTAVSPASDLRDATGGDKVDLPPCLMPRLALPRQWREMVRWEDSRRRGQRSRWRTKTTATQQGREMVAWEDYGLIFCFLGCELQN